MEKDKDEKYHKLVAYLKESDTKDRELLIALRMGKMSEMDYHTQSNKSQELFKLFLADLTK